jgi:hypothetical protein
VNPDHVHIFFKYPPKYSQSFIAKRLKGTTRRILRKEFPHLKEWCGEHIEQYIKQRTSENLEKIIAKVKQKRSNDSKKGYEFIVTNIERLGLPELEKIVYPDEEKHVERLYEFLFQNRAVRILLRQLIGCTEDEETGEVSDIHFIVSSDFIEGMREAAKEIYEKSK